MEPIPEAVTWAERADAWAQPQPDTDGQALQPVSRWSEVVAPGRPTFPSDGVGWRTETAEWRSTEQTARWRQTTEWRSSSGTHGWRSTTEAWQTGDGAEGFLPPADPPTRQQLAISGTAWPTPQGDDRPGGASETPAWERPADGQSAQGSWQRFPDGAPPRQPASDDRPAWQQFAAPPAPWQQQAPPAQQAPLPPGAGAASWQQLVEPTPTWQQPAEPTPAWQQPAEPTPTWQQPASAVPAWQPPATDVPSWAQPASAIPAWQQPAAAAPAPTWQQPASAAPAPTWQQPASAAPAPTWQQAASAAPAPTWQQPASAVPAPAPAWQQPAEEQPGWQRTQSISSRPAVPPEQIPGRQRTDGPPSWQAPVANGPMPFPATLDDGRHLVREDDRAQWRRESAAGMAGVDDGPRPGGRRRAADPGTSRNGAGTGWARAEADNWAGHTDTGSMPAYQDPSPDAPSWGARAEAPGWQQDEAPSRRRPQPQDDVPAWRRAAEPDGLGRRRIAPDDVPGRGAQQDGLGRRQLGPADDAPSRGGQRADAPSWLVEQRGDVAPGRRPAPDEPARRRGAPRDDTAGWRTERMRGEAPGWREDDRPQDRPGWREDDEPQDRPGWQRDGRQPPADEPSGDWRTRSDSWRGEPDSGSWSRGEEPRSAGWRRPADPDDEGPNWRDAGDDTGNWRRDAAPAADPWAQSAADTGVIPMAWQQPETNTASWRSAPDPGDPDDRPRRGDPASRRRSPAAIGWQQPVDEDAPPVVPPEVWQRGPVRRQDGANWPTDEARTDSWRRDLRAEMRESGDDLPLDPLVGEAVTEIRPRVDPASWRQDERSDAERGSATYREATTGDWRQELAAQSDLADGESRRYGTQDFVPFRPSGSIGPVSAVPNGNGAAPRGTAAVPPASAPTSGAARAELLVPSRNNGASWQDPPDTQWPPRGALNGYQGSAAATGSYERRAVSTLPSPSGRQNNLLEPDEDEIEESTGGPLAAVGYTVIWYGVPVVLFVLYMLVLNGSEQAHALSTLAGAAPQFGLSLVLSMAVAVGLRWASGSWKAASVGLAAAVVGGGLATVLTSAITGNSLS